MDKLLQELNLSFYPASPLQAGHNACPGCGSTTAARLVFEALQEPIILFVPASCASLYFNPADTVSLLNGPIVHTTFPGAFAQAEGMAVGLQRQGRPERVVVWAGDGATYDIGLGGLSGIAARGADVLVICNDNEGYQNTGGHSSTATPPDASTPGRSASSPPPIHLRKDLAEMMALHRVPYVATASAAFPQDLQRKVRRAMEFRGFRFLLLFTTCVTWGYETRYSVKLARLAVETGYFPLYEVEYGILYRITYEPSFRPLEEFTSLQRRFRGADLTLLKQEIAQKWEHLRRSAAQGPIGIRT